MEFSKERQNIIKTLKEKDFPKDVIVEVTGRCNLSCIMCPHKEMTRPQGDMSYGLFRKIATEVAQHRGTRMWLAIMGEPLLLGQRLIDMVKYAKKVGIKKVCLNTNGVLLSPEISKDLVKAGLDEILIGLDANTVETYNKIRVGGSITRVAINIGFLKHYKEKLKSPLKIIVQYIVMEENKHEVDQFKKDWLEQGVIVKIRPKLGWRKAVKPFSLDTDEERYPCPWLINAASIQWNGKFNQCDGGWSGDYSPGDINKQTISEVWNGELKERRAKHWAGDFSNPLCKECEDWKVPKSKFYYPRSGK